MGASRALWLWGAFALLAAAGAAKAQSTPVEPPSYRQTIDEALGEYEVANYVESRALFARAHALFPNARTFRGLGMVEFELRNYIDSIAHLERALSEPVHPLSPELRRETEALLARARNFVARLRVKLLPARASLSIDGLVPRQDEHGALLVQAGDHELEVHAEGFVSERRMLKLLGGEEQTLSVVLTPVLAPPPARERAERKRIYRNPWLWTGVGALLAGSAVALGLTLRTNDPQVEAPYGGSAGAALKGP